MSFSSPGRRMESVAISRRERDCEKYHKEGALGKPAPGARKPRRLDLFARAGMSPGESTQHALRAEGGELPGGRRPPDAPPPPGARTRHTRACGPPPPRDIRDCPGDPRPRPPAPDRSPA